MSVKKLCEKNQEYRYEIVDLREKILKLEEEIKVNEKKIWKECEHASGMYDKNCYYCKHCKLWRNHYMYQ